jgi:hypothetical protein
MSKMPKPKPPLEIAIDPDDQFAWMQFTIALVWGGNPRKMKAALATISADGLGVLHEVSNQPIPPLDLPALSRALGLPVNEVARMPGAVAFYRSYFANPTGSATKLRAEVFNPAGHYTEVAAAPGWDRLLSELQRTSEQGGFFAGQLLLVIVRLDLHHPNLPASLNRAIAVLTAVADRGAGTIPSNLKKVWRQWRHLAPLWAAYIVENQHAQTNLSAPGAAELETVHDPGRLRRILSSAKWFGSFAASFSADRARGPLIPSGDVLQIISDVDEMKPDLEPLAAEHLDAAARYRAPTNNYD